MPARIDRVALVPERDVEDRDDGRYACGPEPWLGLDAIALDRWAGHLVEIAYRLSFWDDPARPVFRFWQGERFVDRIGAGPIGGRATWVGRIPPGTQRVSVSPTSRIGRFDFAIESLRMRHWPALIAEGLRRNPRPARSAVLTRLIGWAPESDVNLAWATGSTPLADYDLWRKTHERPLDLAGIDRPRFDWTKALIRLAIVNGQDSGALQRTIASLCAQVFPAWRAVVTGAPTTFDDPRVTAAEDVDSILGSDDQLTCVLMAGDVLHPNALAIVAERAARDPETLVFYGDEWYRAPDGTPAPRLKPGWSPRLQGARPYLGRAVFIRDLATWDRAARTTFLTTGSVPPAILGTGRVLPLRRLLVETDVSAPLPRRDDLTPSAATATIIIPTRNHPALLRRIVASIRAKSRPGRFRLVVVDNASTDPEAIAEREGLRAAPDTLVLDHAGPFNFSLICNEGAAAADTPVLVFLNDDMEVLSEGWLDRLVARALEPGVGAVGARLTYPDGRLQHVGVLVGMGESAGHFGAPAPGDDPGWAERNGVTHEVSAVTGACLAVARQKFDAVGGFDAEHLPIELSDIDLCLKLKARGWQAIVDPAVHLMHEESASRGGATLRRHTVHDRERAIFVERWRHVLRDDPVFHPGLSLYRWRAALG